MPFPVDTVDLLIEPIIFGWFPVHISLPLLLEEVEWLPMPPTADPWNYDNFYPTIRRVRTHFSWAR